MLLPVKSLFALVIQNLSRLGSFKNRVPATAMAAIALFAAAYPARAAQPWDAPFAKDTQAILRASKTVSFQKPSELIMLLQDFGYTLQKDGRADMTIRRVFRVTSDDIGGWANVAWDYEPWHQEKPVVQARVIAANGTVRTLDPRTMVDSAVSDLDPTMFSDSRTVEAPLPGVEKEAVVEYQVTVREKSPLFDVGVARRLYVFDYFPAERLRLSVDADASLPLQTTAVNIPADKVRKTRNGNRVLVEVELNHLEVPDEKALESHLPPERTQDSYLGFSTAPSWQAVAARYEAIINRKIAAADLKGWLADAKLTGEPREDAARLTDLLHKRIRYTGVEFGSAAIIPVTPAETIQRGYGDCKDKATLLIALLRAAGIPADLAMLKMGYAHDVSADLPGMGMFDHAIVYARISPPLWIDATADTVRVGQLPLVDQGRLALIANRATTALEKIPESTSADNWHRHTQDIRMSEFGGATIVESIEASGGGFEPLFRSSYGAAEEDGKKAAENYAKTGLAAESLGTFERTAESDRSTPFRMKVQALKSRLAVSAADDAAVAITPRLLFEDMPDELITQEEDEDSTDAAKHEREEDFYFHQPYSMELVMRITPPPLFHLAGTHDPVEIRAGGLVYTRNIMTQPDGTVVVEQKLDSGKRRLTSSEFQKMRGELKKSGFTETVVLNFALDTSEPMALGEIGKALSLMQEAVRQNPSSAMIHARYARLLLTAGMGGEAQVMARKATELGPEIMLPWHTLAWTMQHDRFGRRMRGSWDFAESEKAYRKAIEVEPDNLDLKLELGILLEHNIQGWRYAADSRVKEAIDIYRELLEKAPNATISNNLTIALLRTGDLPGARKALAGVGAAQKQLLDALLLAVEEGAARAVVKLQAGYSDPQQRLQALASLGVSLMQLRYYDQSRAVLAAAARSANAPDLQARAELIGRITRWDSAKAKPDGPAEPIFRMMELAFEKDVTSESFKPLMSRYVDPSSFEDDASGQAGFAELREGLAQIGLDGEGLRDLLLSMIETTKHGDDERGYRVDVTLAAGPMGKQEIGSFYVVQEDGGYRLLGGGGKDMDGVGSLVLELLKAGKLEQARWWLDETLKGHVDDPEFASRRALKGIWSGETEALRGPEVIRKAALSLLATGTGKQEYIAQLEAIRAKEKVKLDQIQSDKAIAEGLEKAKRWKDLIAVAKRLGENPTFANDALQMLVTAAERSGDWAALEAVARKAPKANSADVFSRRYLAAALSGQNKHDEAAMVVKEMLADEFASAEEYTLAVWTAMRAGTLDDPGVQSMRKVRSKALRNDKEVFSSTLALALANLNKTDEAQAEFLQGIAANSEKSLTPLDWLTYGIICRRYGLEEQGRQAFAEARSAKREQKKYLAWTVELLNSQEKPQPEAN